METATKLTQWLSVTQNVEETVNVFMQESGKDKRRLKSKAFKDSDSIWGKCSNLLFGQNGEMHRLFLYTTWTQNTRSVQEIFNMRCGRQYIPIAEVTGDLYCICKKKYESIDPEMFECTGCRNWLHCICIGLDRNQANEIPEYFCPYCEKFEAPPLENKLPEASKASYSFLQLRTQELDTSLSPPSLPLHTSTPITKSKLLSPPRRCPSPDITDTTDTWSYAVEDQTRGALVELHKQCEKLKAMDSDVEEPHQLPTIFAEYKSDEDDEHIDKELEKDVIPGPDDPKTGDPRDETDSNTKEQKEVGKSASKETNEVTKSVAVENEDHDYKDVPKSFSFVLSYADLNGFVKIDNVKVDLTDKEVKCRRLTFIGKEHVLILRKNFAKKNPYCVLGFERKQIYQDQQLHEKILSQVRVHAKCSRKGCPASYTFHIPRIPKSREDVEVTVHRANKIQHEDKTENAAYQLRGSEREKIKDILKGESALKVHRDQANKADQKGLDDGSRGFVFSLGALRKARSEVQHENDRSSDTFTDLILTKLQLDKELSDTSVLGYVQDLSVIPFQMVLYSHVSLEVFHHYIRSEVYPILVIDATDAPLQAFTPPLDNKKPLLYSILPARSQKVVSELPIAEFVSTRHTFADVSGFFLRFFERYKRVFNDPSPHYGVRRIEIDFSKTLLSAAIHVFCRTSTVSFFNNIWKLCINRNDEDIVGTNLAIHVCRFHVLRFFKCYFLKAYKKSADQEMVLKVWSAWANAFVASYDMYSITRRIVDAYVIAGSYYFTAEVASCVENISEPTNREDVGAWTIFEEESLESTAPFYKRSIFGQFSSAIHDSVYFYNTFLKITSGSTLSAEERDLNPYFSQELCQYFKVQIFPYIPILTRTQFFLYDLPLTEDTTNRCERYHNTIKNVYYKGKNNQRAARFVESQSIWIQGGAKLFLSSMKVATKSQRTQTSQKTTNFNKETSKPATLLDKFRQTRQKLQEKPKTGIPAPDQPSSIQSKKNKSGRHSPEESVEGFKKRPGPSVIPKAASLIRTLQFVYWGGLINMGGTLVQLSNTCNFDTVIMVLQVLIRCTEVGKAFINHKIKDNQAVASVLLQLERGFVNQAKEIFVKDILKVPESQIRNRHLDLLGDERETGFKAIANWMRILRRQRCTNVTCPAFRSFIWQPSSWDFTADSIPLDVTIRDTTLIHRATVSNMLDTFNLELSHQEWVSMETKCYHCHNACFVTYNFPGGPPDVLFYPLNVTGLTFDTDRTIPKQQKIQGVDYNLFSVSIFSQARKHYMSLFYHEDRVLLYDGLLKELKEQTYPLDIPVSGVWLIRT